MTAEINKYIKWKLPYSVFLNKHYYTVKYFPGANYITSILYTNSRSSTTASL